MTRAVPSEAFQSLPVGHTIQYIKVQARYFLLGYLKRLIVYSLTRSNRRQAGCDTWVMLPNQQVKVETILTV